MTRPLSLFQAYGIELEYMIVDSTSLDVLPITDKLFHSFAKKYTSEINHGPVSLDNELASHVVEFKTTEPAPELKGVAQTFHDEIRVVNNALQPFGARLMPTAMHPWMDPHKEMRLWPYGCKEVYETLHRIFDCRGHGWANLQSTHINLPFADEDEFVRLHSAIRLVLPLIPSLAASSPLADGHLTGMKDTRLDTYKNNQKKIFSVTGHVIPEVCRSLDEYHSLILHRIYADMAPHDPEGILRYEWVNSRGAIARFERSAIEIRLVDIQEAPVMDLAVVALITRLVQALTEERWASLATYHMFAPERLRTILDGAVHDAEETLIEDSEYLALFGWNRSASCRARDLWHHLLGAGLTIPTEYRRAAEVILSQGTLATRIQKSVGRQPTRASIHQTYSQLCDHLASGDPFVP